MTTINYNGQELECITEGYWPEGVTLVWSDANGNVVGTYRDVVCLVDRHALGVGHQSVAWDYWAILPPKKAPRRLTNREVAELVTQERFSVLDGEWVYHYMTYKKEFENEPTPKGIKLRSPGSDEWLEPTTELLEVGK